MTILSRDEKTELKELDFRKFIPQTIQDASVQRELTSTKSLRNLNKCPICHGSGWITSKDERGYFQATACECRIVASLNDLRNYANIPRIYENTRLKDIKCEYKNDNEYKQNILIASQFVKSFENLEGKGLYFWSKTRGSGKTMMAAAICNEILKSNEGRNIGQFKTVRFATMAFMLDKVRSSFTKSESEWQDEGRRYLGKIKSCDLLVIDDFGIEKVTEWAEEQIYEIINERYVNKKSTIVTSNLPVEELPHDSRVKSRLNERNISIHYPEESVREKMARLKQEKPLEWLKGYE